MNFMKIERPLVIVLSIISFLLLFAYVFYVSFMKKTIEERRVGPDITRSVSGGASNDIDDDDFLARVMLRKVLIQRNVFVRKIQRQESVRELSRLLAISRGEVSAVVDEEQCVTDANGSGTNDHDDGVEEGVSLWRKCRRRRPDDPECAICLEHYSPNDIIAWARDGGEAPTSNENSIVSSTGCAHIFHKECLFAWLQDRDGCPLCRRKVVHADASVRFAGWERVKV